MAVAARPPTAACPRQAALRRKGNIVEAGEVREDAGDLEGMVVMSSPSKVTLPDVATIRPQTMGGSRQISAEILECGPH